MKQWDKVRNSFLTEQDELKSQLESSRQVLKALFDSTRSAIFVVSPDYKIIFFNKRAKEQGLFLCRRALEVGDCILNLTINHNEDEIFGALINNFTAALTGRTVVSERELNYSDKSIWINAEYTPVYDSEKVVGVVLRIKEITERKKYEQQIERQNEQLKQIAWTQSHETRQPVATILGLINVLDKESLTEDNKMIIEMLERTIGQLDKVIRNTVVQANSLYNN